jgi:hypothetical protein
MDAAQLFFQRYDPLYQFWLGGLWEHVPGDMMRRRPHPRVNSIVWNIWHLTRVEDVGLNRFVADLPQVFDDGDWMQRLNIAWRHYGTGMTSAEVDELNERIDIAALREYSGAVQERTRSIVQQLQQESLSEVVPQESIRSILFDEGIAHPQATGLLETYSGWTKGQWFMNFGLTHSYHHVGAMEVALRLLGIEL